MGEVASDAPDLRQRILEATVRCVGRWGATKTTLDDIAREAGCSRATVYRVVPGGKAAVLSAAGDYEVARLLDGLAGAFDRCHTLEELLEVAIVHTTVALRDHRALGYLLEHEPGSVLPHVAFAGLDPVLETAAGFAAPWLEQWLDPDQAGEVAEWVTRLVLVYALDPTGPSGAGSLDLADAPTVRSLLDTYVLAGITRERSTGAACIEPVRLVDLRATRPIIDDPTPVPAGVAGTYSQEQP